MKKLFTILFTLGIFTVVHAQSTAQTKDAKVVTPAVNAVDALNGNVQCPMPGGSCCHGVNKAAAVTGDQGNTSSEAGTETKPASSCQEVTIGFTTVNPNKEKKETPESDD
ncbi:MAG: hypothetical protein R2794_00120 [Chitinophagales bacterium]